MATSKEIVKHESYTKTADMLNIKAVAGDAHFTTHRIYRNKKLLKNGEGEVNTETSIDQGDTIQILSTINKPQGSSAHATVTIEMEQQGNVEAFNYASHEPDFDEVKYNIKISIE